MGDILTQLCLVAVTATTYIAYKHHDAYVKYVCPALLGGLAFFLIGLVLFFGGYKAGFELHEMAMKGVELPPGKASEIRGKFDAANPPGWFYWGVAGAMLYVIALTFLEALGLTSGKNDGVF